MKKWLYLGMIVLLVSVGLLAGCTKTAVTPTQTGELTEEYVRSLPPLFPKEEAREIDFTVLRDVDTIIRKYSVFTSPVFKDTFGETTKDQAYLLRAARDTLFQGFLSVPQDQIPQWAVDLVENEINSGRYNYDVFNSIYQELLKDPRYAHLSDASQKEKLLKTMIEGMIKSLGDPFTAYFDREYWILSEKGSSAGTYRGMGINVGKNESGEIAISGVSGGSPAEKAGLKSGDAILAVDEKSVLGASVNQLVVHIKTREDPSMKLIVRKKLTGKIERVGLVLEEVKMKDLLAGPGVELPDKRGSTSENLPFYYPLRDRDGKEHPEILYIAMKQFTIQMASDLEYFLKNIDTGQFRGIVLDLRNNPGGLVTSIIDSVDYFLTTDDIITTTKYTDGTKMDIRSNKFNLMSGNLPIAILVNEHSASGAELFPTALRDNGRAIIISKDETTAGKGSVNTHFTLRKGEYGALYVSIGLWYAPSGQMIEKMDLDRDGHYEIGGVKPDIKVNWTDDDIVENQRDPAYYDPTLFEAIKWLEQNYPWTNKK